MAAELIELWRGGLLEGVHRGHAVIAGQDGIIAAWGDPDKVIFSRSSCKMIQALPLVESGAADAAGLQSEQLALACASHNGGLIHTRPVGRWLEGPLRPDDIVTVPTGCTIFPFELQRPSRRWAER